MVPNENTNQTQTTLACTHHIPRGQSSDDPPCRLGSARDPLARVCRRALAPDDSAGAERARRRAARRGPRTARDDGRGARHGGGPRWRHHTAGRRAKGRKVQARAGGDA
jgi:hypothetical protein